MGITLRNVSKSFGALGVVHDVSLDIPTGDFAVFVGPSGCGKSTLLRMIAGLEETTAGSISIEGRDVTEVEPAKREVAMVFQSYALYPHLTVFENMAFSLRLKKTPKAQVNDMVQEAARILHLEEQLQKRPSELSGGQRQRVAIGRAIVRKPKVFLFDEPLSNLDAELRVQMRLELAKLHREIGATMIYVTHDQVEAMTLADRIFVLKKGVLQQAGKPLDLYDDPHNQFVGGFIGSPAMNFLPGRVVARQDGLIRVALDGLGTELSAKSDASVAEGTAIKVGIRPEHLVPTEGGFEAVVDMAEDLGGVSYLHARLATGKDIVVELRGRRENFDGKKISLSADAGEVLLFAEDGSRLR